MALIEKKLVTERETASYKLDRATIELIRLYSEFIGSPQEHVVNEALLFIFRKDKEFNDWLKRNKPDYTPAAHAEASTKIRKLSPSSPSTSKV
jgi:hypothetical protein